MKFKIPFILDLSRRFTALLLAVAMLVNLSGQAAAQYRPFINGNTPAMDDFRAIQDNTRVVTHIDQKLMEAKLASVMPSVLSYEEVSLDIALADPENLLSEEDYKTIYELYRAEAIKGINEKNKISDKYTKHPLELQGAASVAYKNKTKDGRVWEYINPSLPGKDVNKESNKQYFDYDNYMQGLLRAMLSVGVGAKETNKEFKWNSDIMLSYIKDIYNIATESGISKEDAPALKKYLKFVLAKADNYCDNDFHLVNIMPGLGSNFNGTSNGKKADADKADNRRKNQCNDISYAMLLLAFVGRESSGQEKLEYADILYTIVKDNYKEDYGATVFSTGIAALLTISTVDSYKKIEQLLTKDTITGISVGTTLLDILDLLSISAWSEKGISAVNAARGGGGSFLNRTASRFQYIDEDSARAMGINDFSVAVMKDHPSLGYNIPYRNVLQDIGIMIASSGTKEGHALTNKILTQYVTLEASKPACMLKASANHLAMLNCSTSRLIHAPLVAGLLEATTQKNATVTQSARLINNLDWWDLNEATQRSINNSVADKNISGTTKRTFDQAKQKRNDYNTRISTMSLWADMVISAIFITMLISSLPSIVKSAGSFIKNTNRIRVIKAAGKGNLLNITKTRIKGLGVKPAQLRQQSLIAKNEKAIAQFEANKAAQVAKIKAENLAAEQVKNGKTTFKVSTKNGTEGYVISDKTSAGVKVDFIEAKSPVNSYLSKARQQKALAPKDFKPGELQPILTPENTIMTVDPIRQTALTATVGEGGSGASAAAKGTRLSWQERLANLEKDRVTGLRLQTEAGHQVAYQAALKKGITNTNFKGNFFFNKSYNQLPKWKQWIFDQYYFNLKPTLSFSKDLTTGLIRNPGVTLTGASIPFGTTVEINAAAQVGIYARAAQTAQASFEIGQAAEAINAVGTISKAGSTISTIPGLTTMQGLAAMGGIFNAPRLVTILNEPQAFGNGSTSKASYGGSFHTPEVEQNLSVEVLKSYLLNTDNKLFKVQNSIPLSYAQMQHNLAVEELRKIDRKVFANKAIKIFGPAAAITLYSLYNQGTPELSQAVFLGLPFLSNFRNFITERSLTQTNVEISPKLANKYARTILAKFAPLNSQLVAVVKSAADDELKAAALLKLHQKGLLNKDLNNLPEASKSLISNGNIQDGLLKIYNAALLENALNNIKDVVIPKQTRLSPEERAEIEQTKEIVNNLNEEVTAGTLDWGTGATPFEIPKTNSELIEKAIRPIEYVKENVSAGKPTKNGIFYEENIPVYYRDKNGNLSNEPRMILSYSKISELSSILSKFGLATKKGFTIPNGLVLAIDEEGKMKLVMPRGNLHIVEQNEKAKKIVLDGKETNRVAVDGEFTSSDMVEIASMLENNPEMAFEIDLTKPDSFSRFLTLHALFIGNDAGNTLSGQFKGYVQDNGGNALVNGMGGVGYVGPLVGGGLMRLISWLGHVKTILWVYGITLAALGYSYFGAGMNGFLKDADVSLATLAIPTTVMVICGSILNTSIQTLLNIYKDPIARSTAHLQFANNKNYSRLGVSALTGLALVSNMGLNWSVVVPVAAALLLVSLGLLFNTRIYDQYKLQREANKEAKAKQKAVKEIITKQEKIAAKQKAKEAKKEANKITDKFHTIYKKELSKKHEMKDISNRVSKLYASYAASLLVLTQTLKLVADNVVKEAATDGIFNLGTGLALGTLALVAAPMILTPIIQKIMGKETHIAENLKKFAVPLVFFATTLATMSLSTTGKALGMALTTLCLLTTTMMRVFSTELIKSRVATDDQLSGLSLPVIALMTSLLTIMPSSGYGALASLAFVLMLYAGTAVPGQLDSARMQNFITSEYKAKKADLAKQGLDETTLKQQMKELTDEEKYMATKGAAKFSYLNSAGNIGIIAAVVLAFLLQDLVKFENLTKLQGEILSFVSSMTIGNNSTEGAAIAVNRLVLLYASGMAWWMVSQNGALMKAAKGLFKKQKITEENIANGKVTAKAFDINERNASIKISAMDKELKDINGIVFGNGKSSEGKMTEILNKLFSINNRLKAIADVKGAEVVAKSFEQLKYITAKLEGMISNNDISFSYSQQFGKLKKALNNDDMSYLEEGLYGVPTSLKNYENGLMLVRELQHLAEDILDDDVQADTYKLFNEYYTRAVQELTQYAQDNPIDSKRVNAQIKQLYKMSKDLQNKNHTGFANSNGGNVSEEDIVKLLQTITLFDITE